MLYEICPICGGDGDNRCPSRTHPGDSCPICKSKRVVEVGLTRGQFDRRLLIAEDADLLLTAVATGKCNIQHCDQEPVMLFNGGHSHEVQVTLPLSESLRERLIQLTGKD